MRHFFIRFSFFILLPILGLELGLRVLWPETPLAENIFLDPALGHRGPKNLEDAYALVEYDSGGFRKIPFTENFGAQKKVAVLGDSLVESITLPAEQSFSGVLQDQLSLRSKNIWQVKNFATGDYGTTQAVLALEQALRSGFKYDLIIVLFSGLTDFINNESSLAHKYQSKLDGVRPYWLGRYTYLSPSQNTLLKKSFLYRKIFGLTLSYSLRQQQQPKNNCRENYNAIPLNVYLDPPLPEWELAAQHSLGILQHLKWLAEGTPVIVAYAPNPYETDTKLWRDVVEIPQRACYPEKQVSPLQAEKRLAEITQKAGHAFVSLRPNFENALKKQKLYLEDGHFNPRGHEVAVKALLDYALAQPGLLP